MLCIGRTQSGWAGKTCCPGFGRSLLIRLSAEKLGRIGAAVLVSIFCDYFQVSSLAGRA